MLNIAVVVFLIAFVVGVYMACLKYHTKKENEPEPLTAISKDIQVGELIPESRFKIVEREEDGDGWTLYMRDANNREVLLVTELPVVVGQVIGLYNMAVEYIYQDGSVLLVWHKK